MSLFDVFKEKIAPVKEKRQKTINSNICTLDYLISCFEKMEFHSFRIYYEEAKKIVDGLKIEPELVKKFSEKVKQDGKIKNEALGLYLSALIQSGFNSGFNKFIFDEIIASGFGSFLKGKLNKPVILEVNYLKGNWNFWGSENCIIKIGKLEGNWNLRDAKNLIIELEEYNGCCFFGYCLKDCIIRSSSKKLLERLEKQAQKGKGIIFKLTTIK